MTSPLRQAENTKNQTPQSPKKHVKLESGSVFTRQTFEDVNDTSEKTPDQNVPKNEIVKAGQEAALALLGENVLIDQISKKIDQQVSKKIDQASQKIDQISKKEEICKNEVDGAVLEKKRKNTLDENPTNEYYCNSCDFKCYALYDLKNHKYSHGGKQYSCDICKYNSPSRGEVARHKKRRHSEKTVSCGQCKFVTYQYSFLKAHMRSKHENISFKCDKCDLTLVSAGGLRRHEQRIHLGVSFTCQECGQKFSTRERLKEHVEAVHEGVTLTCEVLGCEYITSRKLNIQKHMKNTHASLSTASSSEVI